MKKIAAAFVAAVLIAGAIGIARASDYQGEENRGSVFQVLGDLITGNYKVDGKPIKEKGWFQVSADETKKMFSGEEKTGNAESGKK